MYTNNMASYFREWKKIPEVTTELYNGTVYMIYKSSLN